MDSVRPYSPGRNFCILDVFVEGLSYNEQDQLVDEPMVESVGYLGNAELQIGNYNHIDLYQLIWDIEGKTQDLEIKKQRLRTQCDPIDEARTYKMRIDYYKACNVLRKLGENLDQKILEKSKEYNFITRLIIKISFVVRNFFKGKRNFAILESLEIVQRRFLYIGEYSTTYEQLQTLYQDAQLRSEQAAQSEVEEEWFAYV